MGESGRKPMACGTRYERNIGPAGSRNLVLNFYAASGIKAGGRVAGREVPPRNSQDYREKGSWRAPRTTELKRE